MNRFDDIESKYILEECDIKECSSQQVVDIMRKILSYEGDYKFYKKFRVMTIGDKTVTESTGEVIVEYLADDEELSEYLY